jgi:hypothetical protein
LDTGALLMLVGSGGRVFFYCPMCGAGYDEVADARTSHNARAFTEFVTSSYRSATEQDLRKTGLWGLVVKEFDVNDFSIP